VFPLARARPTSRPSNSAAFSNLTISASASPTLTLHLVSLLSLPVKFLSLPEGPNFLKICRLTPSLQIV